MNLGRLKRALTKESGCVPLGKSAWVGDVHCHVVGFVHDAQGAYLLILEHDAAYCEMREEVLHAGLADAIDRPHTNRQVFANEHKFAYEPVFCGHVKELQLGSAALAVRHASMDGLYHQAEDAAALLVQFMLAGWEPGEFACRQLEDLFATKLYVDEIPAFSPDAPLSVTLCPAPEVTLLQQPLSLTVGDGPFASVALPQGMVTIRRVGILDMAAEMEKIFAHHRKMGALDEATIAQSEAAAKRQLEEDVGAGNGYPFVEYDAPQGVQLRFYTQSWLEAKPAVNGRATAVLAKPEVGQKVDVLPQPIPLTTETVALELFSASTQPPDMAVTFA